MLRYPATVLRKGWSRRIIALFIVLSMLLPDAAVFADPGSEEADRVLICGHVQHQHTDSCYEEVQIQDDTADAKKHNKALFSVHHHTDDCYDEAGSLICGKKEGKYYHRHTDSCRDAEGRLTCGLAEDEQYIEPEIRTERRLVCGLEEHVHGPGCYKAKEENRETAEERPEEQGSANTVEAEEADGTESVPNDEDREQADEAQTEPSEDEIPEENTELGSDEEPETVLTEEDTDVSDTKDTDITDDTGVPATITDLPGTGDPQPEKVQPEKTKPAKTHPDQTKPDSAAPEDSADNAVTEEVPVFEIKGDTLIRYNGDEATITVPDGIRKIDRKAFYGNKTIAKVILPDSVEMINSSAFAECPNLERVIISNQSRLNLIGMAAFRNDTRLDTSFAATVKRIVGNAFEGIGREEATEEEQTAEEEQAETAEDGEEEEAAAEKQEEEAEESIETENGEGPSESEGTVVNNDENTEDEVPAGDEAPTDSNELTEGNEPADYDEPSEDDEAGECDKPGEDDESAEGEEPTEGDEPTEDDEPGEEENQEAEEISADTELTIPSAKDSPYQATVTFSADAGIPEGTELVVTESADAPQTEPQKQGMRSASRAASTGVKSRSGTAQPAEETSYASIPSLTEWHTGEETPEIVLYRKTLDISLIADGEEIEPDPEARITVSVTLPGIEDGQKVEVRHITSSGSELLESTNDAGTITFTTGSFSLFEFTARATELSTWTSGLLENTFFGRTETQTATSEAITPDNVTEGLTVLEAFSVTKSGDLWMTLRRIKDLVLGKLESIALYTVEDGQLGSIVRENISLTDILRFNLSDLSSFALVRDSGLRRKTQDLGNIILNGMMPKSALAEAQDVTEDYADMSFRDGIEQEEETKNDAAPKNRAGQENAPVLIAAYDIAILNGEEEYEPEDGNPIAVEIRHESIHPGRNIRLWHIRDDGTKEQINDFTIEEGRISFNASAFSVYAVTHTIETWYADAEGDTYRITAEYGDEANLPDNVELRVTEVNADEYIEKTATVLNTQEELLLYRKFLDISFVAADEAGNETIIEPQAPVSVSVRLLDVTAGEDRIRVVHFGADGAEEVESQAADGTVTFESSEFSVYGFGNALQPLATAETDEASVEILGFSGNPVLVNAEAPEVEEGVEVLGAYSVDHGGKLWIKAELKDEADLTGMESVAIYSVETTERKTAELAAAGTVAELTSAGFAVVRDSGYRHLSFELSPEADKSVVLDGMMPKAAEAAAADVTEAYAEHEYTVPEEEADAEAEQGEETESTAEGEGPEENSRRTTLAAFDISISSNNIDYQPDADHPIAVTITDNRIAAGENIELWHISDDGTEEQVRGFELTDGRITFTAYSFSVYAVIIHEDGTVKNPRVVFHFIADGADEETDGTNAYYIGEPYIFRNKAGDDQSTQILADGEQLELITDPGNQTTKFFYGWYVVTPFPVSGMTDEYGIGTDGSTLYFTWPATPESVSFNRKISITESSVQIGDPVHWSLGNVSGSGNVDKDGNVHVFLAPVFEKYNFVNFMQYPWKPGSSNSSNVMTRKLIALGSSTLVDVKISDVRSTSSDPVHLIFIGWQYNAGTEQAPNWQEYQTVDYTGAEMKDPGRDGVYLNLDLADTSSVDLYPIFVQARWVDYDPGASGSGAVYVPSTFRESWGPDPSNPPEGMTANPERNVFTHMTPSSREGYIFGGWYAYAVMDSNRGEITNLESGSEVSVTYITSVNDGYQTNDHTFNNMEAIQITNGSGDVVYNGSFTVDGYTLFSGDGSTLKFYDSLDRLTLYANWIPAESKITVIYWTENAANNNYTASAVKEVYTSDLTAGLGRSITSGSTITLDDLKNYTDVDYNVGIVSRDILDDVGAVTATPEQDPNSNEAIVAREEIFFDLKEDALSDTSKVIDGQGNTTFNVYFSRKVFKLVFHIGRDGYVKNAGRQKGTNDNWIEWMYKDPKVTSLLGHEGKGSQSYTALASMTYDGRTYDSNYVTDTTNIKKDYVPVPGNSNDQNLYVIEAKYGAYIGDRWPSPVNPNFTFDDYVTALEDGKKKTMYIWTAYYDSLYYRNATKREAPGNNNGNNPDINGIHKYMSAELCADTTGTHVINNAQVHHLVAYFGEYTTKDRYKEYHILKEVVEGVELPDGTEPNPGTDYSIYEMTEWSKKYAQTSVILPHSYYELSDESPQHVISNLHPKFQLSPELEGYRVVYSCYDSQVYPDSTDPNIQRYHIYFFYKPKQYKLTFMYETGAVEDTYYYGASLANALDGHPAPVKEGYYFTNWYTNEAGEGSPFDFNTTMPDEGIVLYPVMKPLQYTVKIDPNGGVIDHRVNSSQSTYFTANYGTAVGEYAVKREFIKLTDKELDFSDPTYYTGTKYYYINMQFLNQPQEGEWGYPTELRNAVYVAEDQIDAYYNEYCRIINNADMSWWTGIEALDKPTFIEKYASYPYRQIDSTSEHYSFMGWYQVYGDGSIASMPYNFNDPVTGPLTLRAQWRLDGGYYIQYNPYFFHDDGEGNITFIVGEMEKWQDPDPNYQLYSDQAPTQILRAPTNTTIGWVFRGWRVVKANGTSTYTDDQGHQIPFTVWEPINNQNIIYYQPGEDFIIDSSLVSEITDLGSIIHMQAFYERESDTERRPFVTDLILDANDSYGGGYINTEDSNNLPPLSNPGYSSINTTTELNNGHPTQINIGDFQSNTALHLYRYATIKEFNGVAGTNFFSTDLPYMLIGFDENADPEHPSTGSAYVPAYSPDSVIAVTRNDDKILYAMWEPMIYVTLVNDTDAPIDVVLSGHGSEMIRIINEVTGEYDREESSSEITVPANDYVKIVMPKANPGSDEITARALNDHYQKKMSVRGELDDEPGQPWIPDGIGCEDIPYGYTTTFTEGTLRLSPYSLIITYTEKPDLSVDFDVNGGEWQESSEDYVLNQEGIYSIDSEHITDNQYEPAHPTHQDADKVFIGWTTNQDIAAHTDFTGTHSVTWGHTVIDIKDYDNLYEAVINDYIWDFSDDPPYDDTLYAVYSNVVTVTFDLLKTGTTYHTWKGPATTDTDGAHVFYRSSQNSRYVTYKLMPGETVPKPADPSANNENNWYFLSWIISNSNTSNKNLGRTPKAPNESIIVNNSFNFSTRITENITLLTSWTETQPKIFTFTVKNEVVGGSPDEEFDYTIEVIDDYVYGKIKGGTKKGPPDQRWGSITTSLKNNQEYTIIVTISMYNQYGGDYSVKIDVIDRDGITIKSGNVIYCMNASNKTFASNYEFTLKITQDEKTGFTTSVTPKDPRNISQGCFDNDEERWFTFHSCMSRPGTAAANGFPDDENGYEPGEASLNVLFKNTSDQTAIVAPTGYYNRHTPYLLLMIFGFLLLMTIGSMGIIKRKKPAIDDPGGTGAPPISNTGPPGGEAAVSTGPPPIRPPVEDVRPAGVPGTFGTDPSCGLRRSADLSAEGQWIRRDSVWTAYPPCPRANGLQPTQARPAKPYPGKQPPCPRGNMWGTTEKRGDAG